MSEINLCKCGCGREVSGINKFINHHHITGKLPNNKDYFVENYINLDKTVRQIAKENNVSPNTVMARLWKFDIRIKSKSEQKKGQKNLLWKGNDVGYTGLHQWVTRNKTKSEFCEHCQIKKSYDLANISGKYKRDINDFKWLCRKCHREYDGRKRRE